MKLQLILIFALFNFIFFGKGYCGGTEFSSYSGARTMSLNNLFIAGTDGLTSGIKNPAGLAFLGNNLIDISVIDQMGQHEFISDNLVHRTFRHDDFSVGGGVSLKLSDNFTAAVAYLPVSDYRLDWPFLSLRTNGPITSIQAFNLFNRIQVNSITPAAAIRFGNVAIGISANIYMVDFNTAFPVSNEQWFSETGLAAYQMEYKLDSWAYGFTFGVLADLNEDIMLGAKVRSGFSASLEGEATTRFFLELDSAPEFSSLKADFEMPWLIGIGLVYALQPNLKINLDGEYSLWGSTEQNIDFRFDNDLWQSRLSQTDSVYGITAASFSFINENSFQAGVGIEYYPLNYLAVRAGYRYSQTPNTSANYNFLFPDVSSHSLSFGIGLTEENLTLDGAVVYSLGIEEEVRNNIMPVSGRYKLDNIIPSITIRYRFY